MATEVQVPIRLKVLQDSISEFQKILNNLQPNTNNWKALNKIINSMSTEAQRLQAQLSTPFSSEKQFTQANKTIDKLEEAAARVSVVMQGLQFSDIKLTPEQINQFTKFEEEINKIRDAYKKLQDETKGKLFSVEKNQSLLGNIGKGTLEKDFEGLESAVENHIKKLDSQIKSRNEKLAELRSDKALGDSATSLITKGMSVESIGEDVFNKYLRHTKDGALTMNFGDKGVSKQALLNAIGEMYHLEPGELQKTIEESLGKSLKSINAEEINNVFKNMNKSGIFSGIIKRGKESAGKIPLQNQGTEEIRAQLEEYRTLAKEMQALSQQANLPGASADTSTRITEITARMRELETTILNGARTNSTYTSSMQQLASQFPQLRSILESTNTQFLKMQQIQNTFNSMKNTIANFMGFYQVLNLTKRAVKEAANHIKELDSVMNKISIVTDMDTSDLWGQIDQYSKMAQTYGTTIKGAYEVSQIYYQQGLETADVLTLTNETLKLAKISGLDYASTTDYMTTAIRGFKMEMQDAATVVDVYSSLAANTAVSQEELAVAMSKTASSMESVGSTFQETSAMIATMVAVTRESATNIGSAMKSIGSRYGELTKDPSKLVDSEGEAMAFNKVDAALQSVGISMKTAEGQFREFTDVIVELGEKWAELDSVQQRYIATQFAGNRQQSRFLALVSNIDLLKQNINVAENSEDVGNVQALKTLDSLESKIEQVRVAYQQFYTTIGVENVWKTFLDSTKSVINTLNGMPKLFGKLPVAAINAILQITSLLKNLATNILAKAAQILIGPITQSIRNTQPEAVKAGESWAKSVIQGIKGAAGQATSAGKFLSESIEKGLLGNNLKGLTTEKVNTWSQRLQKDPSMQGQIGREMAYDGFLNYNGMLKFSTDTQFATQVMAAFGKQAELNENRTRVLNDSIYNLGSAMQLVALSFNTGTQGGKALSGTFTLLAGAIQGVTIAAQASELTLETIPWYRIASSIIAIISGISQIAASFSIEAQLEEATQKAEDLADKAKELKATYNTLDDGIKKYRELEKTRYDSVEAAEAYQTAVDDLANSYPQLIESYTLEGEAILNINSMEQALADARNASAEATLRATQAEITRSKKDIESKQSNIKNSITALTQSNIASQGINLNDNFWGAAWQAVAGNSNENQIVSSYLKNIEEASKVSDFSKVFKVYDELEHYLNANGLELNRSARNIIDSLIKNIQEFEGIAGTLDSANIAAVSAAMNKKYGSSDSSILKSNSGLLNLVDQGVYKYITEFKNSDFSVLGIEESAEELLGNLEEIWGNLTDSQIEDLNTILNNPSSYTASDLSEKASQYGIEIDEWMLDLFNDKSEENKQALQNKSKQVKEKGIDTSIIDDIINDENTFITLNERKILSRGLDQAVSLQKNGYNEQNFLTEFVSLYQEIAALSAEARNNLISQLLNNGFTKEGLVQTLQYIEREDINLDTTSLTNLINQIIPNIQLTVDSIMESLTEELDNFESLTSSLQSGVKASKLQKTIDTAKSLGIEIERSDFIADGDKFIINYEKYKEVLSQLKTSYEEQLGIQTEEIQQAYTALGKNINDIDSARLIFGGDFDKYYEQGENGLYALKSEYDNADFQKTVSDAKDKAVESINNYYQFLNDLIIQWSKTLDWKHGDYSSLSNLNLDTFRQGEEINRLQELIRNPEELTESEAKTPDVLNAVEQYKKGWDSVLTDLTTYGIDYLQSHASLYEGLATEEVESLVNSLQSEAGETIPEAISRVAELAGKTISEINSTILGWVKKNSNFGKGNALSKLVSGFTLDSLENYISANAEDKDINSYINEDGTLKGSLADVYEWDEVSNSFRAKEGVLIDKVFEAWTDATGQTIEIGSDLHLQILKDWVDNQIKESEKNDKFTQGISALTSAKVGQRLNIVGMDSRIVKALRDSGVEIVNNQTKALTQAQINAAILAAAKLAEEDGWGQLDDWERLAAQEAAEKVQTSISQYDALAAVMKDTVSSSEAKTWAAANGMDDAREAMSQIGYEWDESLGMYVSTADSIIALENEIASLESADNNDAAQQKIATLRAQLADLKYTSSDEGKKYQAINDIFSDTENVSNAALEALKVAFAQETLNWTELDWGQFITDNNNGTSSVSIIEFLKQVGYSVDNLFSETVAQTAQRYLSALTEVQHLVSEGTTDYTKIDKFNNEIEELVKAGYLEGGIVGEAFNYDSISKSYKLTANAWKTYVEGETARLEALNYNANEIHDILTKEAASNIDFDSFLQTGGQIARSNLKDQLQTWLTTKYNQEADEATLEYFISSLEAGGQEAINVLQNAAKSEGKELSTEEIEAAYRAQIAPLSALADTLSTLEAGSIVASNQIEALRKVGFDVDAHGVIQSTGDLVRAYRGIYNQMKQTGEATLSELNKAMGNLLDNKDGEQQAIDALNNATNMTYSQLAEIYTKAGKELTEYNVAQMQQSGILKALGGNKVMITNFERFASEIGWAAGSEEYTNALKAYRDGLISYDQKTGSEIKSIFDAVSGAKLGDKINVTYLGDSLTELFGNTIENGILTIKNALALPQLAIEIGQKAVAESGMLKEELDGFIASIHDNILDGITSAFGYNANGTNSIASMQAFAQEYNILTGENKDYSELFGYDTILNTFTLNQNVLKKYIDAQKVQLESLGLSGEAIDEYIKDQTDTVLRESIELDNLLNASTSKQRNDEANKLLSQIRKLSNYGQISNIALNSYYNGRMSEITKMSSEEAYSAIQTSIIAVLERGGEDAVKLLKAIKGEDVTSEELEAVYNSQINKLNDVVSQVGNLVAGQFVGTEGKLYEILNRASAVDNNGVVQAGFDMVSVYAAIYAEMSKTAGNTTAGLNDVYAELMTAQDQSNINIIDALKNGNKMSYKAFGELLAQYDIKLKDYMEQSFGIVERDGFGNIHITDWEAFAKSIFKVEDLNAIKNTPEYISAFKAYNDGLIKLNKNTEQAITDEIKQIEGAKNGDWLNLSEFYDKYSQAVRDNTTQWQKYIDSSIFGKSLTKDQREVYFNEAKGKYAIANLNTELNKFGANFEDGILKIGDNANLLGIAQTLEQASADAGLKIGEGLEKVKDAVLNILKSYAEAITKGISGGLTNTEMSDLITKAKDFGITDLQFNETAEGFQLAETSAIKLYQALKSIDSLHAEKAFNALSESLQKTNENFKTTEALMAHITKIRNDTYAADDKISNARKEQYEAELAVAEEILAVRSTTEDNSFNFMDQKIPSGQNNPLNYWKGWQKAFDAIKASKKSKRMDYTDFYNLMTEMGNLSAMMGGQGIQIGKDLVVNSQNYTDLITKAAKNLTTTSKDTNLKVNLPAINVDFSSAKNMVKDVEKGIDAMADEQISMLDGMIALLETIVAMEKLNDITAGGEDDTKIDIGDILPDLEFNADGLPDWSTFKGYAEDYKKIIDEIKALAVDNEDLAKGLKNTKLRNGEESFSLEDIFGMTPETLASQGKDFVQAYSALLEGFRQASISGNYDEDDIFASIKRVLAESGINDLTLEGEKSTIFIKSGVITQVRWEDPDVQSVLEELGGDTEEAREKISSAIDGYLNGEGPGPLTIEQVLKIRHHIKVDPETKEEYVEVLGQKFSKGKEGWEAALAEKQLEDMGINPHKLTEKEIKGGYAETTTTIGTKNDIQVRSEGGNVTYSSKIDGLGEITGSNPEQFKENIIKAWRNREDRSGVRESDYTDEMILYQTIGIRAKLSSTIVDKDGNAINPASNPDLRKKLQDYANNSLSAGDFKKTGDGNYTFDVGNVTYTISGAEIENAEGGVDPAKAKEAILKATGLDIGLKETISAAITDAFKGLKDSVNELDSKPLTELANAFQRAANNIKALTDEKRGLTQFKTIVESLEAEKLDALAKTFTNINDGLTLLVQAQGNWEIINTALSQIKAGLEDIESKKEVFTEIGRTLNDLIGSNVLVIVKEGIENITTAITDLKQQLPINIDIDSSKVDEAKGKIDALIQSLAALNKSFTMGFNGPINGQNPFGNQFPFGPNNLPFQMPGWSRMPQPQITQQPNIQGLEGQEQTIKVKAEVGEVDVSGIEPPEVEVKAKIGEVDISGVEPPEVEAKAKISSVDPNIPDNVEINANGKVDFEPIPKEYGPFEGSGTIDFQPQTWDYGGFNGSGTIDWNPKSGGGFGPFDATGTIHWTSSGAAYGSHFDKWLRRPKDKKSTPIGRSINSTQPRDTINMKDKLNKPKGTATAAQGISGTAKAMGDAATLMGELGPELVVSNGRYRIVGVDGPEMVPLAKDAIVFNHLQTRALLTKGMSKERGRAVTNERNAVAFASGNVNGGPAMASASAALAALKQLRAMWQSLKSAKVSDLAGAGGGGGGGGGGSGNKTNIVDPKAWVDTVERWYNLMQEIAKLEQEITYQEKIRSKISSDWAKDGNAYFYSQKKSLKSLKEQIAAQEKLNVSRQDYFNKRVDALKEEPLGKLYQWDEESGTMKFRDDVQINGKTGAMEFLTDLVGFDNNKGANYTNKEKYDILMANGFGNYMKYDSNGMEIKMDSDNDGEIKDEERESFYENATKAFWDKVNEYKEATESLHDSINEGNEKIEELETERNKILEEIRENQLSLENQVLDAIVESREREIENVQNERDALEKSVGKYIDGLSDALDREQQMYEDEEAQAELNRKKRRLGILQRSGGSASEINSLQQDIRDSERNLYFDAQQAQIDAIQEASDKEIERLDNQINIMTQTLEYQKQFGLLWNEVYNVMSRTPEYITSFIAEHTSDFWAASPLAQAKELSETMFSAEQWGAYKATTDQEAADIALIAYETKQQRTERDFKTYDEAMKAQYGENYDPNGEFAKIFRDAYNQNQSLSESRYITEQEYYKKVIAPQEAARREAERRAAETTPAPEPSGGGGGGGGGGSSSNNNSGKQVYWYKDADGKTRAITASSAEAASQRVGGTVQSSKNEGSTTYTYNKDTKKVDKNKNGKKLASGGYTGHGLYELGELGTETVLTAKQTQVLRNNILSNRPNSLISLLKAYNEGFSRMNSQLTGTTTAEDNSTNIDKVEINMNVQQISNDYDARRAGEQAMNEIMRIARKTSAANSIRR